jgi:hypothetical protein
MDRPMKNALPKTLYRFTKLDEYFFHLLIRNEFRFASTKNFNDPYDGNIEFARKDGAKTRKVLKRQIPWAIWDEALAQTQGNDSQLRPVFKKLIKKNSAKLMVSEHEYLAEMQEAVYDVGVCCFSEVNNDLLLWSHYADSHHGICVGYDVGTLRKTFNNIHPMHYSKQFPRVNVFNRNDITKIHKILLHKSIDWQYEKEVRITDYPGMRAFQKTAIKEICFGLKTPPAQINAVVGLLFKLEYDVKIYQVEMRNDQYQVHFKKILVPES